LARRALDPQAFRNPFVGCTFTAITIDAWREDLVYPAHCFSRISPARPGGFHGPVRASAQYGPNAGKPGGGSVDSALVGFSGRRAFGLGGLHGRFHGFDDLASNNDGIGAL